MYPEPQPAALQEPAQAQFGLSRVPQHARHLVRDNGVQRAGALASGGHLDILSAST